MIKQIKKIKIILTIFFLLFLLSLPVSAQEAVELQSTAKYIRLNVPIGNTGYILQGSRGFGLYIQLWYSFIVGAVGIMATVMIMYAGIKWITSRGNTSVISDAKEKIWAAVMGMAIAFLSYTILAIINPGLLTINLPGLTTVDVLVLQKEEPQMQDFNQDSETVDTATQQNNTKLLTSNGINIASGVRTDGLEQRTIEVANIIQANFGQEITITSGYRPSDSDSQHSLGKAFDLRRSEEFNSFMNEEVIGNNNPIFDYHGQPGYHVNYNGMTLVVIDEPDNNCWHIDTRLMN